MRPLPPSPSETRRLPSPHQAGSGPAPFRLPRGPRSQLVCPSPSPRSSFLIPPPYSLCLASCSLLPQRISYLPHRISYSPSYILLHVTYAPLPQYSLTLLCISYFLFWISTSPQYSPSYSLPAIQPACFPVFLPFSSASLCSLVCTAYYSVRPPGCLHPTPGHLSPSCSVAVIIAHLPGYRLEGAGTTGCQETPISASLTLSSSESGIRLPSLSPSRSLSLLD